MAFKIVFLGSPEFAVISLRKLLETGATLAGVVTAPDRPKGRTLQAQATPVRLLAEQAGIPVLAVPDVNAPAVLEKLRSWQPNVIVLVAFGQILKDPILQLPPLGCVNVHPSLLPLYRGAAPMQRALLEGKKETGVTICKMVCKLDAGDILAQQATTIEDRDTFGLLHNRLANLGAELLIEALKALASGTQCAAPQDDAKATYAPKLTREEEFIRWDRPAAQIHNLVRALNPAPGASASLMRGKALEELKIWAVREDTAAGDGDAYGTVLETGKTGFRVATGKGSLWIEEIQSPSKARMPVARWLPGHPLDPKKDRFIHVA